MKYLIAATVAATLSLSAAGRAADFHAEVMEWVVEPCMEASAALSVTSMDREKIDLGIKRSHIAKVMAASRDAVARDLAAKMKPGTSWEARRAVYPVMLRLCLKQLDGMR